jgi:DNA-binding protein H-NS
MSPESQQQQPSLVELRRRLEETNQAIADRRVEELKVLADGYARKCQINGFTITEAIAALKPYLLLPLM